MSGTHTVGWSSLLFRASLALVLLVTSATVASAQLPSVVRVDEAWELVVSDPNSYSDAPQVSCVISPVGNIDSVYANFQLNHRTLPDFAAGGLQLQVWNGEEPLAYHSYPNVTSLSQAGETITWTQSMQLSGGMLTFEIIQGNSVAWGVFGGQGNLKSQLASSLANLNGYRPDVSVANSGVGFAGNRVQSLTLKSIRLYFSTGEQVVDDNPRSVYVKN